MFITTSIRFLALCLFALCLVALRNGVGFASTVETTLSNSEDYPSSDSSSLDLSKSKIDSARTNLDDNLRSPKAGLKGSSQENKVVNYVDAFAVIRKNSFWPLQSSPEKSIMDTFGPIVNHETKEYEFHRGLDIAGSEEDPVTAVYSGTVHKITRDEAGLKEIVIKHSFPELTQVHPENDSTNSWYSIYSHVKTELEEGDDVVAGDDIGQLGDVPHLHFEVRVGTTCSLEDGIDDNCEALGYDPHVHPLLVNEPLYGPDVWTPELEVQKEISPLTDGMIRISTSLVRPDINRYEVQVVGGDEKVKKSHILDLNLRKGFDATTQSKLNDVDDSKPYLQPVLLEGDEKWSMGLVLPSSWVGSKSQGDRYRLFVEDIWGRSSYLGFTSDYKSWCRIETSGGEIQIADDECAEEM